MNTKKLRFPIIRGKIPTAKNLSMDDYLKFVNLNLRYTVDRDSIRRQKRLQAVNVPFTLKK